MEVRAFNGLSRRILFAGATRAYLTTAGNHDAMKLTKQDWARIDSMMSGYIDRFAAALAAALGQRSLPQPGGHTLQPACSSPAVSGLDTICKTYDEVTCIQPGLGEWTLRAIKKASRGQPDSPFIGRITTVRRLMKWLTAHPEFVSSRILQPSANPPVPMPNRVRLRKGGRFVGPGQHPVA